MPFICDEFLGYLRGIETGIATAINRMVVLVFLGYLRGIETLNSNKCRFCASSFLGYLRGIETVAQPAGLRFGFLVFRVPPRN